MKRAIKQLLQRFGLYHRLKYSGLFRIYQRMLKPEVIKEEEREVAFYRSFLPAGINLIFDIGGYDGHKTAAFLELSKRVVCVEPDPDNFALLQVRFRHQQQRVFLENKAMSASTGQATLYIHHAGSAFNTMSTEWKALLETDTNQKWNESIAFSGTRNVQTDTLDALIQRYGRPEFIKLDVEGWEQQVLKGLSIPIPFLSFEGLWPDAQHAILGCLLEIKRIAPSAVYNVATHEQLCLPSFVDEQELINFLSGASLMHIEILVDMNSAIIP